MIWKYVVGVALGLLLVWCCLVIALLRARPEKMTLREVARLLPDTLRLIHRLARDKTLDRRVRWYLWALLAYLACPIDLIPDFIPVIGYADDAVIVFVALRSVAQHAGVDAIKRHWPGTPEGLSALLLVVRVAAED